jgi:hypothetical protein
MRGHPMDNVRVARRTSYWQAACWPVGLVILIVSAIITALYMRAITLNDLLMGTIGYGLSFFLVALAVAGAPEAKTRGELSMIAAMAFSPASSWPVSPM